GVHVGHFRRSDNAWDIEIAVGALWRPDTDGFIGEANVEGVTVRLGKDGDRSYPQFLASADNAQCNLASIRDQNLIEHVYSSLPWPDCKQVLAILHRLTIFDQNGNNLADNFRFDLVHQLHRFNN